jgi:rhodanese-related sulfurtransferase
MLRHDPALELASEWQSTYALWKEVIDGKEFWSLLMAADLKGDFEQVATFGEIGDLRGRAWRLITSPLAEIAKDALLCQDNAQVGRALAVLRGSGLPQTLAGEYEQEILGPLEDEFEVLLAVAFSRYRYEVKTDQSVGGRRETCWRAHAKFNEQVKPALRKILELGGAESTVVRRVFATAADALDELAEGFETGFDHESKLKMLRKAWQLAPPESAALLLVEEHLAAAGDAGERQPKTDSGYARQLSLALREPVAQPELFTTYIQKEETEKGVESWGKGASKFIFFMVLALLVGKCFNSLPGSSRKYPSLPVNLNVATPRYTPPLPEFDPASLVGRITVGELQTRLKAKMVTLVHVGAKGEYDTGHIPGALWMPESEVAARVKSLPQHRRIVLYCYCDGDDASSRRVAVELQTLRWLNVSVLEGGYGAWLDAGLPVEPARSGQVRYGNKN